MQFFLRNALWLSLFFLIMGIISTCIFPAKYACFYQLGYSLAYLFLFSFLMIKDRARKKVRVKSTDESLNITVSNGLEIIPDQQNENLHSLIAEFTDHQILQSVLTEIHSEHNSSSLRSQIIKNAVRLCGAHGGKLVLLDNRNQNISFDVHYDNSQTQSDVLLYCQSIIATVVDTKKAAKTTISDVNNNKEIHFILAIPLLKDNLTIGVIVLVHKSKQFFDSELANLFFFASQAALAITNTLLFEEAMHQAQTDSLTGLYNHRHFFDLAKKEINRAQRYKHSLTVLMVDIDHFKYINDTFGHPAGDQVLIIIANLCRKLFRNIDIVGRYGGEEYAILLPETPLQTAIEVAERLRHTVERTTISYHRRHILVTISLGIASLRNDCTSITRLIERADTALYHAKAQGRNRVVLWKASMYYVGLMKYPRTYLRN